jgi:7,8-dihydropterin-6-yl-methyl-4-(beta-D-ribofuranosyl)aminobenzene 5'-phosphate synthase
VGCGHQTLSKLLYWVTQVFDEPLYGIIGGLHYPVTDGNTKILGIPVQKHIGTGKVPWQPITKEELHASIQLLQNYAPKIIGLSPHDSCNVSIEAFRQAFGDAFKDIVVGKIISIGC